MARISPLRNVLTLMTGCVPASNEEVSVASIVATVDSIVVPFLVRSNSAELPVGAVPTVMKISVSVPSNGAGTHPFFMPEVMGVVVSEHANEISHESVVATAPALVDTGPVSAGIRAAGTVPEPRLLAFNAVRLTPLAAGNVAGKRASGTVPDERLFAFAAVASAAASAAFAFVVASEAAAAIAAAWAEAADPAASKSPVAATAAVPRPNAVRAAASFAVWRKESMSLETGDVGMGKSVIGMSGE